MRTLATCATTAGLAALVALAPANAASQEPTAPAPTRAEAQTRDSALVDSLFAEDGRALGRLTAEDRTRLRAQVTRRMAMRRGMQAGASGRAPSVALRTRVDPDVRRVREVVDDGTTVRLDDGSVWEVWVADRARSAGWQRGDAVRLRTIAAPTSRAYDIRLENVTSNWNVAARMTGGGRR